MGFQSWEIGLSGRGEQTGLLVAAAVAPGTFEPSLMPRTTADQGMVMARGQCCRTATTVAIRDTIEAIASTLPEVAGGVGVAAAGGLQRCWTLR